MKRLKIGILYIARFLGLFALARRLTSGGIRILCYHGLWRGGLNHAGDGMFMSEQTFGRRLEFMRKHGYPIIPLSQAADYIDGKSNAPPTSVVITIDDGWYSTYEGMLPALQHYNAPATLYCDSANLLAQEPIHHLMAHYIHTLSDNPIAHTTRINEISQRARDTSQPVAVRKAATEQLAAELGVDIAELRSARTFDYMSLNQLRHCARSGVDVQLHTHNHTLHDMSAPIIEREIDENRARLSEILQVAPQTLNHFCYPSGIANVGAADVMDKIGIASAATLEPGLAWPGTTNRQLLPRFVDSEAMSEVEFEAILSGFYQLLVYAKDFKQRIGRTSRQVPTAAPATNGAAHR